MLDDHFEVEPCELAHMSVSEAVLRSEHRAYLEHSFQVSLNAHLLIQLRRLGQTPLLFEVVDFEHIAAPLASPSQHLRSVDLYKFLSV